MTSSSASYSNLKHIPQPCPFRVIQFYGVSPPEDSILEHGPSREIMNEVMHALAAWDRGTF
jgi:hypothetical protein